MEGRIYTSFEGPYITAVLGPRRVGKSTLVQRYLSQHPGRRWAKLNMDRLVERQRCIKGDLPALIQEKAQQLIGQTETIWVAIDEAQKCPELFEQIKILYDEYKDRPVGIKFILTGSGSLSLHQLSAETLAGRIEILYLRSFSVQELACLKNNRVVPKSPILDLALHAPLEIAHAVQQISPYKLLLDGALQHALVWGGLPEAALLHSDEAILVYLGNYLQTYLEKDVRAVEEITNLPVYQRLIETVAAQTGSVRDDKKVLESIGCARDTLKKYRGYLLATLMYEEIYPFIESPLKRLTKSPKGFLVDNGLIGFLTGIYHFEQLESTGLLGHRFENCFLQTLNAWLDQSIGKHTIYYWRTSGGVEVDFVVDKKPFILPFEVTVSAKKDAKKIKHLKEFMKNEKRAAQGFYVYQGPYEYDSKLGIHFLPAWAL